MQIVVIGAGVVGFHLAQELSKEGHDVAVVDSNIDLIQKIEEKLDVLAICGDASLPSVAHKANMARADLVIAVTDSDTTNLLVSLIARKLGSARNSIRVRNREFSSKDALLTAEDLGADMILNPIEITTHLLERLIRNPGATDVAEFANGELCLWGFQVTEESPLVGIPLKDLKDTFGKGLAALIVAISKADGTVVIPKGDDQLELKDHIYVFIHRKSTGDFRKLLYPSNPKLDRIVIAGASRFGVELAQRLQGRVKNLFLVEADREKAEAAGELLPKTSVLCGDPCDESFAKDYGFDKPDYFLCLKEDDQSNLMNGLLMQKQGAKRTAVLAQHPQYLDLLHTLEFDAVVNPRLLTVNEILTQILSGRIEHITRLGDSGAEAREYVVTEKSPLVDKPLKDVGMPSGALACAIFHGDNFRLPDGNSVAKAGDHMVVMALPEAVESVDRLFNKRKLFNK